MKNIIFCSGGNDSVALIQWVYEKHWIDENFVLYSNTGWAAPFWPERIKKIKKLCWKYGMFFIEIQSEGMEALVKRKSGWPMAASKFQFCSDELKVRPAREWMFKNDPDMKAICWTGIRQEESQNRKDAPGIIRQSEKHAGRDLFCPLVRYTEKMRDVLIKRAGFEVLPHNSKECFPCINSNRSDFRQLASYPEDIEKVDRIEKELGYTRKGKPRVMFRPYRHMGAVGIYNVIEWAKAERGKYKRSGEDEQLTFMPCQSGFCGF
jgi:3'-phosphoadenosine 5'-phosphosulfate sulfotransferase (PAPS reductase)/FAD synthetase